MKHHHTLAITVLSLLASACSFAPQAPQGFHRQPLPSDAPTAAPTPKLGAALATADIPPVFVRIPPSQFVPVASSLPVAQPKPSVPPPALVPNTPSMSVAATALAPTPSKPPTSGETRTTKREITVLFGYASSTLAPREQDRIRAFLKEGASAPASFYVVGQTDNSGDAALNAALASRRASTVRDFLTAQKVPTNSLFTGTCSPCAATGTTTSPEAMRSVRIEIKPS